MEVKASSQALAGKRWRFFAIFWPLLCFVFAGIIIGQPGRTADERICDVGFTIFPLVFFALGMSIRHRLLKERGSATVLTTAIVISEGRRRPTGGNKLYFPQFGFQVDGTNYTVTSSGGSGHQIVKSGDQVDLYYTPGDPRSFYVPALQRYAVRCSCLYCGIGILFPLIGLFAPPLRSLVSSLP